MRTHNSSPLRFWFSTLLAGAALGLVGCGGSNKDHHDDHHDHGHDHDSDQRGRLIFSTSTGSDLGVFDQAQNTPAFLTNGFSRNGNAASELILNHDGLSLVVLDGEELTILSSGLEHLNGHSSPHAHEITQVGPIIAGVKKIVASQDSFSILKTDGASYSLAPDGHEEVTDNAVVYPSLLLEGSYRLKFTGNATETVATVVDHHGQTLTPNITFTCDAIKQTVQTVHLTAVLCNDKNLYWVATEHNANGVTVNGKQAAKSGTVLNGFDGLLIASAEDNTIAAYSANQLWLLAAHGDHIHSTDASTALNGTDIIQAAALTDKETITLLTSDGKITFVNFDVKDGTALVEGQPSSENITSSSTIVTTQLQLIAGAKTLWVINKATGELYSFDAHDDHFHQHDTYQNDGLKSAHSAVFAHYIDTGDDHDDHEHGDHDEHDHNH